MSNNKCQIGSPRDPLATKTVANLIRELFLLPDQSAEVELALPGMGTIQGMTGKTATVRHVVQFADGPTVLLCLPAKDGGGAVASIGLRRAQSSRNCQLTIDN